MCRFATAQDSSGFQSTVCRHEKATSLTRRRAILCHDQTRGLKPTAIDVPSLCDDPAHADLKHRLLAESFDAHVLLTTDVGCERIAPM